MTQPTHIAPARVSASPAREAESAGLPRTRARTTDRLVTLGALSAEAPVGQAMDTIRGLIERHRAEVVEDLPDAVVVTQSIARELLGREVESTDPPFYLCGVRVRVRGAASRKLAEPVCQVCEGRGRLMSSAFGEWFECPGHLCRARRARAGAEHPAIPPTLAHTTLLLLIGTVNGLLLAALGWGLWRVFA